MKVVCYAARSEFGRRAEPERSEGGGARRCQTARAWPRAAQQKKPHDKHHRACFGNRLNNIIISLVYPLDPFGLFQSGAQSVYASFLDPCLHISSSCATGARQAF